MSISPATIGGVDMVGEGRGVRPMGISGTEGAVPAQNQATKVDYVCIVTIQCPIYRLRALQSHRMEAPVGARALSQMSQH